MKDQIIEHLKLLELERDVKVLFAIESGSRAWGFPSPDSDYDVRFFYINKKEKYLSVTKQPDSIDYFHGELLDLKGWDLKKALGLLLKSNASIFEWMQSPIVYQEEAGFKEAMLDLLPYHFESVHVLNHYRGLGKNSFSSFDGNQIKLKKCFYVLRPLLAALWVLEKGTIPPMDMENLYAVIEGHPIKSYIEELIEAKRSLDESYVFQPKKALLDFIEEGFAKLDAAQLKVGAKKAPDRLDDFFRKTIGY